MIARLCDAYVMHGDHPARVREKIADLSERRERLNRPPMTFGVAAYAIVRPTEADAQRELARITNVKQTAAGNANYHQWLAGTKLEQKVSLEDYSVSNRGLRSGLVGTPQQIADRIGEFEAAGVDLLLLQCSPSAGRDGAVCRDGYPEIGTHASGVLRMAAIEHARGVRTDAARVAGLMHRRFVVLGLTPQALRCHLLRRFFLRSTHPLLKSLKININHRRQIQRQHLRNNQAAYDGEAQAATRGGAGAPTQRDRQRAH
jgi:hypothetical protein